MTVWIVSWDPHGSECIYGVYSNEAAAKRAAADCAGHPDPGHIEVDMWDVAADYEIQGWADVQP